MATKLLLKNIKGLVQARETVPARVAGADMKLLPVIENGWMAVDDGEIIGFGDMSDFPGITDWSDLEVIDCTGRYVLPAWCDSHTHLVFAAPREGEFVDRINGLTYGEIAQKGGGILNSARKLQTASEDELLEAAIDRAHSVMQHGTGAIEIKSGYGLTHEAELKMLRVARKIGQETPLTVRTNFLGAHALPLEYKENRTAYIDKVVNEMLPAVAEEKLADYIDVFCETNYFTPEETDRILAAGAEYGLRPKIHVNQFTAIGGVQVGIKHNALSVDHLEVMRDEDIAALAGSGTMPTMLPSCSFFLSIPYAPARQMIEAGLAVALATDFNPGSTPSGNIPFVISLACIKMRMTPEEAINAATINAAYAMGLEKTHGAIAVGYKANFIVTKPMQSLAFMPYAFGSQVVDKVYLEGALVTRPEGGSAW